MLSSFRNLFHILSRYKVASLLNLLGLSIAFTAFLLVTMHVRYEYGYNPFPNKERIVRFEYFRDSLQWEPNFSRPVGELMLTASPHIKAAGLMQINLSVPFYVSTGKEKERGIHQFLNRITPGFTEVFGFNMAEGDAASLNMPDKILIPQSLARKLYGQESALGQSLHLSEFASRNGYYDSPWGTKYPSDLTVGGVYRDFPPNSLVANHIYAQQDKQELMSDWYTGAFYCYLLLDSPASADAVLAAYKANYPKDAFDYNMTDIRLRPVSDLYFGEYLLNDYVPHGNKTVTDLLLLIALLVVLIASINFVNFSVALTPLRIKSINTQKVLGCPVSRLRRNLVMESLVITLCAFLLALFFTWSIEESRWLDSLLGPALALGANASLIVLTGALAVLTGLFSGFYPAWHMTSFPPALVLNGSFAVSGQAKLIRKGLIAIQYIISIVLIVCALFIHIQTRYVNRINLGFNKEQLLQVRLSEEMAQKDDQRFKQMLLKHPDIVDVGFTQLKFVSDEIKPTLGTNYKGKHYYHYLVQVSHNFPEMIGVSATRGRNFRPGDEQRTDGQSAWMFNESAAKMMDLEVGTDIRGIPIVGIFPDLHFESMHHSVKPMGFLVSPKGHWNIKFPLIFSYIKVRGNNVTEVVDHVRNTLREIDPSFPADIRFFDKTLDDLYAKSHNQGLMVTLFSLLAVVLSIIGVFGLVVFEAQGRIKEIAVRRVMGATVHEILMMFNTGFVRIVLICFVVAAPLAWYGVTTWLQGFAYKTPIHAWVFLIALMSVLILTILTVTFQSYRAATTNPARSLHK